MRRNNMKTSNEPAVVYGAMPSILELQDSIVQKIKSEQDTKVLYVINQLLKDNRIEKLRQFVYAHFDESFAKSLEQQNFFIDKPFPQDAFLSDNEVINQAEESPIADKETVEFAFSKWELA